MCMSREQSALRWMVLLVLLNLMACKPQPPPPEEEPKVTGPVGPSLYLELQSLAGEAVPEATVQLASGPRVRADAAGQLLLEKLQAGVHLLNVEASGFSPSLVAFNLKEGVQAGARLKLLPLGEPIPFDASQGHREVRGDLELTIPPGALFDEEGKPIQGEVEAFLATLNLEGGELVAAPGLMEGISRPGTEPVGLESLGVVVLVFKQDGKVIPFARRIGVRGRVPGSIRVGSQSLPENVPTWRLEQGSGQWLPTGDVARIVESRQQPGTKEWEVTVDNPSPVLNVALPNWWRSPLADADNPLKAPEPAWVETACLSVKVEDEEGQPVAGRTVVAEGVGYMGVSRGVTDGSGRVLLGVTRAQEVKVEAGGEAMVVTAEGAGTCRGQGAAPQEVRLGVPVRTCTPGAARDCAYGGPKGTLDRGECRAARQYCDAEGARWSEACQGEVLPQQERCDNAVDDNCDGALNETCASVCQEGEERSCYEGPAGSEGVEQCHAGTQKCVAGGTAWGACEGQVLPRVEDCSTAGDEDCNGVACQCWPGQVETCAYGGPAGTEGVGACHAGTRTCGDSGTGWGACTGEVTPLPQEDCTTPIDDDCDGVVNEGDVCVCVPNSSQGCYSGPVESQGVGVCQGGTQQCNASGTAWGPCDGEVTPQTESCANTTDDDCNGQVNDAPTCVCLPGTTGSCYSGPAGTEGVGLCKAGTRTCAASGTAWEACTGDVTPLAQEDCTTVGDDDCDGVENEGDVCVCAPNSTQGCYSGPAGTQGVGVCKAGTQTCNAMGTAWDACTGEVTPQGEICASGGDEDCDGQTDEAPPCGWGVASPMASARYAHTATLLGNGKVLVVGGQRDGSTYNGTAELYDPVINTWSSINLVLPRAWHTATPLGNGKVLVAGGYNVSGYLNSAELYDPATHTSSSTGTLATARDEHTATLLGNGKVLVTGGDNGGALGSAELYDLATNTWSSAASMGTTRRKHTATLLGNGRVLVTGGYNGGGVHFSAELYDPASNTWSPVDDMSYSRDEHTATLLGNGKVIVVGGSGSSDAYRAAAELYDPATNTWSSAGTLATARELHTATLLGNGKVLVAGGRNGSGRLNTAEVYDPATNTWSSAVTLATARALHTATPLGNGQILVVGGYGSSGGLNTAEVYEPGQGPNTWSSGGTLSSDRFEHTATLLGNGKVLVAGGYNGAHLKTAEVYDPATNTWSSAGSMTSARTGHAATLLGNGKVLVVGGISTGSGALSSAEVYDPATNTWSSAGPMTTIRVEHTVTRLGNGQVLVVGGRNNGVVRAYHNTAELYDPATNTWSSVGTMATARELHTATLLGNGKVLVSGGRNGSGPVNTAEVYNPATNTWSPAGTLATAREVHTATLLGNGKVLVSGGKNGSVYLNTAEVYAP